MHGANRAVRAPVTHGVVRKPFTVNKSQNARQRVAGDVQTMVKQGVCWWRSNRRPVASLSTNPPCGEFRMLIGVPESYGPPHGSSRVRVGRAEGHCYQLM